MEEKRKLELFITNEDVINDLIVRPITAGSIAILTKVESPLLKDEQKSKYESYKAILDFAFCHIAPIKDVIKASNNNWNESVEEFSFQLDQGCITKIGALIAKRLNDISDSGFDVQQDLSGDKKKA